MLEYLVQKPFLTQKAGPVSGPLTKVYCCDLLSLAMSKAPTGGVWVTVMNNINTIAVAALCDVSAVILAEGVVPDENMIARAEEEGIALFSSSLAVFETAKEAESCL